MPLLQAAIPKSDRTDAFAPGGHTQIRQDQCLCSRQSDQNQTGAMPLLQAVRPKSDRSNAFAAGKSKLCLAQSFPWWILWTSSVSPKQPPRYSNPSTVIVKYLPQRQQQRQDVQPGHARSGQNTRTSHQLMGGCGSHGTWTRMQFSYDFFFSFMTAP